MSTLNVIILCTHCLLSSCGLPPAFPTCCVWRLQACGWGCRTLPWSHRGVTPGPLRRTDDPDPQEDCSRYLQLLFAVPWWIIPAHSDLPGGYCLPWTFSECLVQYINVWFAIWKVFTECSVKILVIYNRIFVVTFEVLNLFLGHWNCVIQMNLIIFLKFYNVHKFNQTFWFLYSTSLWLSSSSFLFISSSVNSDNASRKIFNSS